MLVVIGRKTVVQVGNDSLKLTEGLDAGPVLPSEYLTSLRKVLTEYRQPGVTVEVQRA